MVKVVVLLPVLTITLVQLIQTNHCLKGPYQRTDEKLTINNDNNCGFLNPALDHVRQTLLALYDFNPVIAWLPCWRSSISKH